jgi:hypothetical protein
MSIFLKLIATKIYKISCTASEVLTRTDKSESNDGRRMEYDTTEYLVKGSAEVTRLSFEYERFGKIQSEYEKRLRIDSFQYQDTKCMEYPRQLGIDFKAIVEAAMHAERRNIADICLRKICVKGQDSIHWSHTHSIHGTYFLVLTSGDETLLFNSKWDEVTEAKTAGIIEELFDRYLNEI